MSETKKQCVAHNINKIYREDFACKCGCGFMAVDKTILEIVVELEKKFGKVTINRACSCKEHNDSIPNSHPNSFHTKGMAGDLKCEWGTPEEWAEFVLDDWNEYVQIVIHKTFIHVEIDYR